jgi:hypothetical protein
MQHRLLDGNNGQLVAPGLKMGFCLPILTLGHACQRDPQTTAVFKEYRKVGLTFTLRSLPVKWIDITGLPDGYYTLEMTVNPQGLIVESDYSNNTATLPITIGQPIPANDNFDTAMLLNGRRARSVVLTLSLPWNQANLFTPPMTAAIPFGSVGRRPIIKPSSSILWAAALIHSWPSIPAAPSTV